MACPVCFTGDDPVVRESLTAGIGVLVGVTLVVLTAFAGFFVVLARRARLVSAPLAGAGQTIDASGDTQRTRTGATGGLPGGAELAPTRARPSDLVAEPAARRRTSGLSRDRTRRAPAPQRQCVADAEAR